MFQRTMLSCTILLAICTTQVQADYLLRKLPADGTSATYLMEAKEQSEGGEQVQGTMIIQSVGQVVENGKKARWIEFNIKLEQNGMPQDDVVKLLIPEEHLGKGKNPADHIIRGWLSDRRGVRAYDSTVDNDHVTVTLLLANAFTQAKEVKEARTVEYQSGKLEAKTGLQGKTSFELGPGTMEITIQYWISDQVPFGTMRAELTMQPMFPNQPAVPQLKMNFTFQSEGKNAMSGLPDKN